MKTERLPSRLRVMVPWLALLLVAGCMPRMTLTRTAHYHLYEDLTIRLPGGKSWTKTDIRISKGAIVAFLAKGEIWGRYPRAYARGTLGLSSKLNWRCPLSIFSGNSGYLLIASSSMPTVEEKSPGDQNSFRQYTFHEATSIQDFQPSAGTLSPTG